MTYIFRYLCCSLLGLIFVPTAAIAQRIWYNPGQEYLKIPVTENGVYRISQDEIKQAGWATDKINPQSIQIFHRGVEIAISVQGEADQRFDATDFILFYGERNDGAADSTLFRPVNAQPHQFYSLYSDTTYYYVTYQPGDLRGKRMTTPNFMGVVPQTAESYHLERQLLLFTDEYAYNTRTGPVPFLKFSNFEKGEGWTGKMRNKISAGLWNLKFNNWQKNAPDLPQLAFQLQGRDLSFHKVQWRIGNETTSQLAAFGEFDPLLVQQTISLDMVSPQNELTLSTQSVGGTEANDRYSLNYIELVYPQSFDFSNQQQKFYYLRPNVAQSSVLNIPNVPSDALLYDLTDKNNPQLINQTIQNGTLRAVVSQTQNPRNLLLTRDFKKVLGLIPVTFRTINPAQFDYLIVTHAGLRQSATAYAAYRASTAGGGYRPLVVDYQTLRDQFNFGERSPLVIRRFVAFMYNGGKPKMLFLMGRAVSIFDTRNELAAFDLVPSVGYPGSDVLLTDAMAGSPENVPSVPTGRLNVTTNAQVLTYLEKVKDFERLPAATPWRKNLLHLTGGKSFEEIVDFKQVLADMGVLAQQKYVGANLKSRGKVTTNPIEKANIGPLINEGVGVMSFFGHSGSTVTDFDIGFASKPENGYRNKQKYPLMIFNGCGVGNVFFNNDPLTTDWLLTPDAGSVAMIAHSYFSYFQPNVHYLGKLYQTLFQDSTSYHLPIGTIHQRTAERMRVAFSDPYDVGNTQQMVLQGDPAIRFFPFTKPDFELSDKTVFLTTRRADVLFANADSVFLKVPLKNLGRFDPAQVFKVSLKRTLKDGTTLTNVIQGRADTLVFRVENNRNVVLWDVTADSDNAIDELNEKNNVAQLAVGFQELASVSVFSRTLFPDRTPPIMEVAIDGRRLIDNDFVAANPTFSVQVFDENPMDNLADSSAIEVFLQRMCTQCQSEKLTAKSAMVKWSNPDRFSLRADFSPATLVPGTYILRVRGADVAGNEANKGIYTASFRVGAGNQIANWRVFPNPAIDFVQFNFTATDAQIGEVAVLKIYNVGGALVRQTTFKIHAGENRNFWLGDVEGGARAVAGAYLYEVRSETNTLVQTGKFFFAP